MQKRSDAMCRHPSENSDDGRGSRDRGQGWSLVTRFNKFEEPIHYRFANFFIHTLPFMNPISPATASTCPEPQCDQQATIKTPSKPIPIHTI